MTEENETAMHEVIRSTRIHVVAEEIPVSLPPLRHFFHATVKPEEGQKVVAETHIVGLRAEYSGGGDSGQFDEVYVRLPDGAVTNPDTDRPFTTLRLLDDGDLYPRIIDVAEKLLNTHYPGWEINEGSSGGVDFLPDGSVYLDHYYNEERAVPDPTRITRDGTTVPTPKLPELGLRLEAVNDGMVTGLDPAQRVVLTLGGSEHYLRESDVESLRLHLAQHVREWLLERS